MKYNSLLKMYGIESNERGKQQLQDFSQVTVSRKLFAIVLFNRLITKRLEISVDFLKLLNY